MPVPAPVLALAHLFYVALSCSIAYNYIKSDCQTCPSETQHAYTQALMPGIDREIARSLKEFDIDCPSGTQLNKASVDILKLELSYNEFFDAHVRLSKSATSFALYMAQTDSVNVDMMHDFMSLNMRHTEDDWKTRYDALNVVWRAKQALLNDIHNSIR